jgi:hypothetical protein
MEPGGDVHQPSQPGQTDGFRRLRKAVSKLQTPCCDRDSGVLKIGSFKNTRRRNPASSKGIVGAVFFDVPRP